MNTGRVIGIILIGMGILGCLLVAAMVGGGYVSGSVETAGGVVFGLALAVVLAAPFVAVGAFMLIRGQKEAAEMAVVERQKKLLGMVRAQGRVNVANAALELKSNREQVKSDVYDLVNKGLFTGYINWTDGDLISADAAMLSTNKCPKCGGEVELAGKGVVKCPYCGTEIFLSGG